MRLRIALVAIMVASITGVVALTGILPTSAQSALPAPRGALIRHPWPPADHGHGDHSGRQLRTGRWGHRDAALRLLLRVQQPERKPGQRCPPGSKADQNVRFTLQGDTSFTYTVTASSTPGSYDFSGTLRDFERDDYPVGGATRITVEAPSTPTPSATRSFNSATVAPGGHGHGDHSGRQLRAGRWGHRDAALRLLLRVQ